MGDYDAGMVKVLASSLLLQVKLARFPHSPI